MDARQANRPPDRKKGRDAMTSALMRPTFHAPNLRWNAFTLGLRLILAAANPWSGLSRQAADRASWHPADPFGLPRWWPFRPGSGKSVGLDQLALMRSVLRS